MEGVPIVSNFKQPIKHVIKLVLNENDVKLLKLKANRV